MLKFKHIPLKLNTEKNIFNCRGLNDENKFQKLKIKTKLFCSNKKGEQKLNNTLKEYNDVIINKYQNMEEDLNREKNDRIHLEKKQIKNKNAAKILTEFVLTKYREMNEKQLQNEIFQMEKDEEELLIEEISKKITNHLPIQSQKEKIKEIKLPTKKNSILFDTNDPKSKKIRNIEAIYLTLLKFKGLKRGRKKRRKRRKRKYR